MDSSTVNQLDLDRVNKAKELEQYNVHIPIRNVSSLRTMLIKILCIDSEQFDSYKSIYDSDSSYRLLFDMLKKNIPFTVFLSNYYVDRFYRDSYYIYYASKLSQYSRFCKRIFLFKGIISTEEFEKSIEKTLEKRFMGTMVIRPLSHGKIGRSLLNPYYFADRKSFMRYAIYNVVVLSKQLRVYAFPFSMQDGETTTCAEVTILNLIDYFSRKYQDYKIALPSEVFERVDRHGYERSLPTKGLKYSEISRVFSEIGFYPRLYSALSFQNEYQFKRNMHYYIESGIPVAVGIQSIDTKALHSITCIGHGEKRLDEETMKRRVRVSYNGKIDNDPIWIIDTADLYDEYIVMDDGKSPYSKYAWKKINEYNNSNGTSLFASDHFSFGDAELKNMMVPLSKRMFLEAEDAYDLFVDFLSRKDFGIRAKTKMEIGTIDDPLVLRIFLASSRHFRQIRSEDLLKKNYFLSLSYSSGLFPKFVWVCEIYTVENYLSDKLEVTAELVIDATSSSHDLNSVIICNYGQTIRVSNPLDADKAFTDNLTSKTTETADEEYFNYFHKIDKRVALEPYTHNLHLPRNKYK